MMIVLFLCPIGVRKAHEAATATAIRKGSGLTPRLPAICTEMGAAIRQVATLFRKSDRVMVTIISTVSVTQAGAPAVRATMPSAISWALPAFSKA